MKYQVTQARPGDIDEIMRIENECFERGVREERGTFVERIETFPGGSLILLPGTEPEWNALPAQLDARGAARKCAGYICSEIWASVPAALPAEWKLGHSARERHVEGGTVLYVSSFAVDPAFRGNGTGKFFFTEAVGQITGRNPSVERIAFIVNESWLAARRIYETEGFRYTGKMERFFRQTESALIMEKEL